MISRVHTFIRKAMIHKQSAPVRNLLSGALYFGSLYLSLLRCRPIYDHPMIRYMATATTVLVRPITAS